MEKANQSQLLYKSGYVRWHSGTGSLHNPLERHSEVLAPFMMYLCKTTHRNTSDAAISWETVIQHTYVCSGAAVVVLFASPFETCVVDGALVHCVCVVQVSIRQLLGVGASLRCRGGSQMPCKKTNKQNFHLLFEQQVFISSIFPLMMSQWTPASTLNQQRPTYAQELA